jgi:hypothetical protein
MSFLLFKLLFAAIGFGLLVVSALILRQLRRGRAPSAPKPLAEPRPGARLRTPRVQKTAAEPEPEAPPPPRKRQLRSLSEVERLAAEDAEPATAEAPAADDEDLNQVVLARLETAFDRLQAGQITLEAYREDLLAEQARVEQRIAALRPAGESEALNAALAAQESVRWCLDWAKEQGARQSG